MEDNNLYSAPTKQELFDSNFLQLGENDFCIELNSQTSLHVRYIFLECEVFLISNSKNKLSLKSTKAKINDAVNIYGQGNKCDFVWNRKPQPKVGEVWENDFYTFLIIKDAKSNVLKLEGETIVGVDWINYEAADYDNFQFDKFTKIADTLEDYYKQKFKK